MPWVECPAELGGAVCSYQLDCQGGPISLDFECSSPGGWQVVPTACALPYDSCPGTQVNCWSGQWQMWTGTNPPPPCPATKPAIGEACMGSAFGGAATCGFRCEGSGDWTVGSCYGWDYTATQGAWLFDGVCAGDCSLHERALLEQVSANQLCDTAADCRIVFAQCAYARRNCTGAFYVNHQLDEATWGALDKALSECAASAGTWPCGGCDMDAPPPDCISGRCMPIGS